MHTDDPHTRPLGLPARTWTTVMTTADWRCQCTGTCGSGHRATGGRCDRTHAAAHGRTRARLIIAPTDPTLTTTRAAHLSAGDLRAWCQHCWDHTHTRHRRQATTDTASTLF